MKTRNYLRLSRKATVALTVCLACTAHADITYQLLPGSTITPGYIGQPSGPSEPLTGTFTWHLRIDGNFHETSLRLQSASFLLTLDMAHNFLDTAIFPATQTSFFGAEVLGFGGSFPSSSLDIRSYGLGTYEGPANNPTLLVFSELYVAPDGGGNVLAAISFEAVQVPEPKAPALALVGLALLAARQLRPWTAEQNKVGHGVYDPPR